MNTMMRRNYTPDPIHRSKKRRTPKRQTPDSPIWNKKRSMTEQLIEERTQKGLKR